MEERLIIACKFEGTTFYVFLNLDLSTQEFVVTKTVPHMNVDNNRFPFDNLASEASTGAIHTNLVCEAIKAQLESYLNNTR